MVTWANATGGPDISTVNTDISDLQSAIANVEQTTQNPMDPSIVQAATTLSQDAEQAAGADPAEPQLVLAEDLQGLRCASVRGARRIRQRRSRRAPSV
jgi:hypothetical protein